MERQTVLANEVAGLTSLPGAAGLSILIGLLFVGLTGCNPPGERLIDAHIERDGEHLLQVQFASPEDASPAAVWEQLADQRFKSVAEISRDQKDLSRGVLKGKIRIVVRHAGNTIAAAEVDTLRIDLVPGADRFWTIPRDELERAGKKGAY